MDEYTKKSGHISKLANLPDDELTNHLSHHNPTLSTAAPGLAPHLYGIAAKGIQYLNNKLPKPAVEFSGQDEYEPSEAQKSDWLDHHEAVDDPISILKHVKNGELTGAHMEALSTVHPDLLQEMQHQVMSQANPKDMRTMPYTTKLSLSKFLGKAMDESLLPNVIAQDQANYNPQQPQAAAGTPKRKSSTLGGLEKLNLAKRASTETQQDESDE